MGLLNQGALQALCSYLAHCGGEHSLAVSSETHIREVRFRSILQTLERILRISLLPPDRFRSMAKGVAVGRAPFDQLFDFIKAQTPSQALEPFLQAACATAVRVAMNWNEFDARISPYTGGGNWGPQGVVDGLPSCGPGAFSINGTIATIRLGGANSSGTVKLQSAMSASSSARDVFEWDVRLTSSSPGLHSDTVLKALGIGVAVCTEDTQKRYDEDHKTANKPNRATHHCHFKSDGTFSNDLSPDRNLSLFDPKSYGSSKERERDPSPKRGDSKVFFGIGKDMTEIFGSLHWADGTAFPESAATGFVHLSNDDKVENYDKFIITGKHKEDFVLAMVLAKHARAAESEGKAVRPIACKCCKYNDKFKTLCADKVSEVWRSSETKSWGDGRFEIVNVRVRILDTLTLRLDMAKCSVELSKRGSLLAEDGWCSWHGCATGR